MWTFVAGGGGGGPRGSGSCRVVVFCIFFVFARSIVKTGDFGTNNSYVARRFWPSSLRMYDRKRECTAILYTENSQNVVTWRIRL